MILKFGSLSVIEKVTSQNWRDFVVSAQVKQDEAISKPVEFNLDDNFMYFRARAVSAGEMYGPNANGDYFPEAELAKSYKTFISRGFYLNHDSDAVEKARGILLDSEWDKGNKKYVECLVAVDKSTDVAHNMDCGIITDVSMGAMVGNCECSECHKVATMEEEYCDHLRNYMGKEYNGKRVYAINRDVNFYELSAVTVGADQDAKILERVASKKESSEWSKLLKLAADYSSMKEFLNKHDNVTSAADAPTSPIPAVPVKPPVPSPKKEDKKDDKPVLEIDKIVEKEVDKNIENAIVDKVRNQLKKETPSKALPISEQDLLSLVRQKLQERKPVASGPSDIHVRVKAIVDNIIAEDEKPKVSDIDLGDGYSVRDLADMERRLVELVKDGKSTGVYIEALPADMPKDEAVKQYRKHFRIDLEPEKEPTKLQPGEQTIMDTKSSDYTFQKGDFRISYRPGKSFEDSLFVATNGRIQTSTTAAKLLSEATKKAILTVEAKGTEFGVGEYSADGTEKPDTELEMGKEKSQPGEIAKGPAVEKLEDTVGDYAAEGTEKPDSDHAVGKDPIQPSDVVKKFAKIAQDENGRFSVLRIAKAWGSNIVSVASIARKAKIDNQPNVSWEVKEPAAKPSDMLDPKAQEGMIAREYKKGEGEPSGTKGNEVRSYFNTLDPKNLQEGGGDQWARKVASLKTQLKEASAENEKLKLQNDILAKSMEKQKKEAEEEKKSQLVQAVLSAKEALGLITASEEAVLELRDTGLSPEQAEAKAYANAVDEEKKCLASLNESALRHIAKTLLGLPKQSGKKTVSNVPEIYRDTEQETELMETKLAKIW